MNFSQTYFDKDLDKIIDKDLIKLFTSHQKESQYLEFKSASQVNVDRVFTDSLKPGICSFLNSEGGILIFGAPREEKGNSDNSFQSEFTPYQKGFLGDHDSIIRKISDGITPMPIGIRLKEVEFSAGFVAVFEIQESMTKPHQTGNIYQIRIDGQKKPAPHYLIEALMKRITFPDIKAYIQVIDSNFLDYENNLLCIKLKIFIINFSEFQNEKNIRFRFKIDGPMSFNQNGNNKETGYEKLDILSFGEPTSLNIEMFGNFRFLKEEKTVNFNIIFHGENCPSKITVYQMKIRPHNNEGILADGKAFLDIDNLLLSEHQKNLGISHKESLKKSLGLEI